jgi:hypothetical protein
MMDILNANALLDINTNLKKNTFITHSPGTKLNMPKEYEVTLSTGTWFLLARSSMDAAYAALELSIEKNSKLINVRQSDEW